MAKRTDRAKIFLPNIARKNRAKKIMILCLDGSPQAGYFSSSIERIDSCNVANVVRETSIKANRITNGISSVSSFQ